jgi:peroxiredoxin
MKSAAHLPIKMYDLAIDFTLPDTSGNPVTLSGYRHKQNVLLVLNRGFA